MKIFWLAFKSNVAFPKTFPSPNFSAKEDVAEATLTKGTTCGLTWQAIKWFTLNNSESLDNGRSLATEPSMNFMGEGLQGFIFP